MIFTARQIQSQHKASGEVRLPIGSRLTPMASDWLRQKKLEVRWQDGAEDAGSSKSATATTTSAPSVGGIVWWCDGPCGQAKAAVAAQAKETFFRPAPIANEPKAIVEAVKYAAGEIKADRAAAAVMLVKSGAAAVVYANRCPSLRAILGTCRDAVQQGVEQLSANVLIVEHPYQSLQQVRNLLAQFVRGKRGLSDEVKRQLSELANCG